MDPIPRQVCMAALAGSLPTRAECVQQLDELGIDVAVYDSAAGLLASLNRQRIVVCALDTRSAGQQTIALATRLSGRSNIGVLALGPAGDLGGRVRSLLLGADAWLTEDAAPPLIAATVYALFRRLSMAAEQSLAERLSSAQAAAPEPAPGWRLEDDGWLLTAPNGGRVWLTQRERDLLILLALEAGKVVSRDSLAERLSALGGSVRPEGVNMMVSRLRQKARRTGAVLPVASLPGRGYLLEVPLPGVPASRLH